MNLANFAPELALWNAALGLLLEDAKDYLRRGPDKDGHRHAAYSDLMRTGPMTSHIARFCALDASEISDQFQAWCDRQLVREVA